MNDFTKELRNLTVARVEDLPYWSSPPIQFVFQQSAALSVGAYDWPGTRAALYSVFNQQRPIMSNFLYYFRDITFSADIEQLDYTSAIVTMPFFQMFRYSYAYAPLFREPLLMPMFLANFGYKFFWMTSRPNNEEVLQASFTGTLTQTPQLVGKNSITLTAVISAQEITDEGFIQAFKAEYPKLGKAR